MERCPMCGDIGWVLDAKPRVEPLGLELLPCLLPDCQWSAEPSPPWPSTDASVTWFVIRRMAG
jgi:hypothetical protein